MSVIQIQKRDTTKQVFDETKIHNAVLKAFKEVSNPDLNQVQAVTDYVIQVLDTYPDPIINIEVIQDVVETALMHLGFPKVAKQYILYRDQKAKERKEKEKILDTHFIDQISKSMNINQLRTLKERYLICDVIIHKDAEGNFIYDEKGNKKVTKIAKEQPSAMFERIAKTLVIGDLVHDLQVVDKNIYHQTKPVKDFNEKQMGNKFYEINWVLFNKYNINAHQAARMLYLFDQIGKFKINPILENIDINGDLYGLKIGQELEDQFETYFGDNNGQWTKYYNRMTTGEYMFNTPVLMNFGRPLGGGNACFVLGIKDDLYDITYNIDVRGSQIYKKAGGLGINFSYTRPEGDVVGDIQDGASGPCSWIGCVDDKTRRISAGTGRRGANMGILEYWHPDIKKFIRAKKTPKVWESLNVSVGTDEKFWDAVYKDKNFDLINPRDKSKWGELNAREFFNEIAVSAHASAEPGLLFFDNTNKFNPFKELYGNLNCTNPCGEQYLYPNDSCTLGSINVGKFVNENGGFEKDSFINACKELTRGLDNVVSLSKYPDGLIEETTKSFRRIGIGIMGIADALYKMRIGYNTKQGYETMEMIAKLMHEAAIEESINLAYERGQAPNWKKLTDITGKDPVDLVRSKVEGDIDIDDNYADSLRKYGIRNCWVGTEAPTGTIAMIAGCSSGIEPLFGLQYEKVLADQKTRFVYWNEHFIKALKEEGLYTEEMLQRIIDNGSVCDGIEEIPEWIKTVFVTAMNIHWADHVYAQSLWQKYVDNSISKTINFPQNATVEDVKQAYFLAHELHCKGLSIYIDKSRGEQILHLKSRDAFIEPSDFIQDYIKTNCEHIKEFLPRFFNQVWLKGSDIVEFKVDIERDPITGITTLNSEPIHYKDGRHSFKLGETVNQCKCGNIMIASEGCSFCPVCGYSPCGGK